MTKKDQKLIWEAFADKPDVNQIPLGDDFPEDDTPDDTLDVVTRIVSMLDPHDVIAALAELPEFDQLPDEIKQRAYAIVSGN